MSNDRILDKKKSKLSEQKKKHSFCRPKNKCTTSMKECTNQRNDCTFPEAKTNVQNKNYQLMRTKVPYLSRQFTENHWASKIGFFFKISWQCCRQNHHHATCKGYRK